jgi:hypothetical protein
MVAVTNIERPHFDRLVPFGNVLDYDLLLFPSCDISCLPEIIDDLLGNGFKRVGYGAC